MSTVLTAFSKGKSKAKVFEPANYGLELCRGVGFEYSSQTQPYGIEIELEGTGLPRAVGRAWTPHDDNSLRGGREYVTAGTVSKDQAIADVANLFEQIAAAGATINNSYRTSTHVHVNVRDMKVNTLAAFVALWGSFEDVLTAWCGPTRAGNLFALRLSDSAMAVETWVRGFKTGVFEHHREMRYLALNPACLRTFGSIEIRSMRGLNNAAEFVPWIEIIDALKAKAATYGDPSEIACDFSASGALGLLEATFGHLPVFEELRAVPNAELLIRDGFRRIQPILYVIPWADAMPEIEKVYVPSPFGAPKTKRKRMTTEWEEVINFVEEVD